MGNKKQKKSKITNPKDGAKKTTIHAFRADLEIGVMLDGLENKSEFIVKAVREKMSRRTLVTCPMCIGRGKIAPYDLQFKKSQTRRIS